MAVSFSVVVSTDSKRIPRQLVFTRTRILSVKVATLATFLVMVKTLDQVWGALAMAYVSHRRHQSSLTQKLVPLLSKIRTKEPAVMVSYWHALHQGFIKSAVHPRWQHYLFKRLWVSKSTGKQLQLLSFPNSGRCQWAHVSNIG